MLQYPLRMIGYGLGRERDLVVLSIPLSRVGPGPSEVDLRRGGVLNRGV